VAQWPWKFVCNCPLAALGYLTSSSPIAPRGEKWTSRTVSHVMVPAVELRQNDEICETAPDSVKHGPKGAAF